MKVQGFHDAESGTITYLVLCQATRRCAVVDAVRAFDPDTGRTSAAPLQPIIAAIDAAGAALDWVLETHVHADHLSGGAALRQERGGKRAIGAGVAEVAQNFAKLFDFGLEATQFDRMFRDGESFRVGDIAGLAMATPGHTPDSLSYLIGDAVFVGNTLFMPDAGTARCDFPGGNAATLYESIQRILALPDATRIFVCHDYKAPGRDEIAWETSVGEQRRLNTHVHAGVGEAEFVALRRARDATLPVPRLMLPSVHVNLRAGNMPPPDANGVRYIRIPIDRV